MANRFSPKTASIKKSINDLIEIFDDNRHLLFEALKFSSKSKFLCGNIDDFRANMQSILLIPGTPWIVYDTISSLISNMPTSTKNEIIRVCTISTIHSHEALRPTVDGIWQLVWEIDQDEDIDEKFVSLDWYMPPNIDNFPNVPIHIIDYVAGCISLLRSNLFTPSLATLFIALESALWDALSTKGIERTTEKITYIPVTWNYKRTGNKLLLSITGADQPLIDLDSILGYPAESSFEIRKVNNNGVNAGLKIEINAQMVGILASNKEEKKDIFSEKGLSEALNRARKENILDIFPSQFDETILRMRNNLIHLPLNGNIDPPITILGGKDFNKIDDLKNEPKFVKDFTKMIIRLINNIYTINQA